MPAYPGIILAGLAGNINIKLTGPIAVWSGAKPFDIVKSGLVSLRVVWSADSSQAGWWGRMITLAEEVATNAAGESALTVGSPESGG